MMTELQNGEISAQSSSVPSSSVQPAQQSRTYTDAEVNDILSNKKDKWIEKGYEKARAELGSQQQNASQTAFASTANAQIPGNLTPEQMREIAKQEARNELQAQFAEQQKKMYESQIQTAANQFASKIEAGRKNYEDFDQVVGDLNLPEIPKIWMTANQLEDPSSLMYELGKNPEMLAQLRNLEHSPGLLKKQMQKLSDSIKQNKEAEAAPKANPPLSRQKPSTVGAESGKDKSEFSVQDWKKIYKV